MTTFQSVGSNGSVTELPGRLADNIVHFVRALRRAGVQVGPSQVMAAVEAVQRAGFSKKSDFYHILRATLISRPEHFELFHQTFAMFWRDPEYLEKMMHMLSPTLRKDSEDAERKKAAQRRAADALTEGQGPPPEREAPEELEVEARLMAASIDVLRHKDFDQMSNAEIAEATAALRKLELPVPPILSRRRVLSPRGTVDRAATMRAAMRRGGVPSDLVLKAPAVRAPTLVALLDISGSMTTYSRMMMHFLHALTWSGGSGWGQVHAFTFGTRLTNVTRALQKKDPDHALEAAGQQANDWEGGTRIGDALRRFNVDWSRRVLGQGAAVLLITDGLERGDPADLSREAERLSLSCKRLIWLNPLLRYEGFSARAAGVVALMPHVHSFHSCHSLERLEHLTEALSGSGEKERMLRAA